MDSDFEVKLAVSSDLPVLFDWCDNNARYMFYPSFFCSGEWLREAAQEDLDDIRIFMVKKDGYIHAVLPLYQKRNRLGGKDLHFIGDKYYPDPLGLVASSKNLQFCIQLLKRALFSASGWDRIILPWCTESESEIWEGCVELQTTEPYLKLSSDVRDIIGSFSKKKRYNLRAAEKKVDEMGGEFFRFSTNRDKVECLEHLFVLHKKRAEFRESKSTFIGPHTERFHRRLVRKSSSAKLFALRVNAKVIAVIYGFEYRNIFYYYQIAHDPEYDSFSPGTVLLFKVIKDCCDRGFDEFNFLQGSEKYKWFWTKTSRKLFRVKIQNDNWRVSVLEYFNKLKRNLKETYLKSLHR